MDSAGFITQNNNILITGASGFIGRHLIQHLSKKKCTLHAINRDFVSFPVPVRQYNGTINDRNFIRKCIQESQPDIIFHLAASKERTTDINSFYESFNTNILGTLNVLTSAVDCPSLKSIVTLGTAEEYGHNKCPFTENMRELPVSPYSFSKMCTSHLSEIFFNLYALPSVVIRPTLAYGPGQGNEMFLPSLITSLLDNEPFCMTIGDQTRDFLYVDDLIDALILSTQKTQANGQIINVGSGLPVKLGDIAKKIEGLTNKHGLVNFGEKPYRKNEVMDYYVDLNKAGSILGWKVKTSLEDGLKKTIDYYRRGEKN